MHWKIRFCGVLLGYERSSTSIAVVVVLLFLFFVVVQMFSKATRRNANPILLCTHEGNLPTTHFASLLPETSHRIASHRIAMGLGTTEITSIGGGATTPRETRPFVLSFVAQRLSTSVLAFSLGMKNTSSMPPAEERKHDGLVERNHDTEVFQFASLC